MRTLFNRLDVRVSFVYCLAASLWIVASDTLVHDQLTDTPALSKVLSTLKGLGFVAVTTGVLFLVLWSALKRRHRLESDLRSEVQSHIQTEASLQKVSRLYRLLSNGNQTLVRANDEMQLLQAICTLLVTDGGYRLTWIGYAEEKDPKTVRVMASAGYEDGYVHQINVTWDNSPTGQGPTGVAIRTGQPDTIRYILTDPRYIPWRSEALKRGYVSSIALPLWVNGRVMGALNVYADAEDAFDDTETALLTELANDVGYGIQALRIAQENQNTRTELEQEREISPVGITILTSTGAIRYANAQAERILGLTRGTITQQAYNASAWRITDYEGNPFPDEQLPFMQVKRTGQPVYGVQHAIEWPDGTRILLEINAAPLLAADGTISEVVATFGDVTALYESAKLLQDREQNYRLLFNHNPQPMWVYDRKTLALLEVNDAAVAHYGYSRAQFLGMRLTDIRPPEDAARLLDDVQQPREELQRSGEWRHQLKNGQIIHVEITSHTLDYAGKSAVLVLALDITERKRITEQLRESEERYRLLVEQSPYGIAIHQDGQIVFANSSAARLLRSASVAELVGMPISAIVHPDYWETARKRIERMLRGETGLYPTEDRYVRLDGSPVDVEVTATPFIFRDRPAVQVIALDITQRKHAEKAFQESEVYLRTILDNLPVGVAVNSVSPQVTFSYVNDNFVKCYRTTREAIITPDSFWEAVYEDPEFRETTKRRVLADIISGQPERMYWEDIPIRRKGEETTFISAKNSPIDGTQLMLSTVWDTTDRNRAQETLRASEEKHKLLFDNAGLGIAYFSLEGKVAAFNKLAAAYMGGPPEAYVGKTLIELHGETAAAVYQERIRVAASSHDNQIYEDLTSLPTGDKWFLSTYARILDASGQVAGVQVISSDITEQKDAEQALRESERFAHSTLDGLWAHIAILDENGTLLAVNNAWRAFAEENSAIQGNVFEGANYLDVCDQASGPESEEAAAFATAIRAVLSGELDHFEKEYPCHSPTEQRWFVGRVTRFPGEGPVRVVVAHENTTRLKLAELKLAEERNLLRTLIDNLPDRIYVKDAQSRYILKNQADLRQIGVESTDEVVGKTDFDYYPPELAQRYHADEMTVFQSGQALINREEPFTGADGSEGWILTSKVPLRDASGNVTGLVGIGHDITKRKQAEEQLREQNLRLSALNRVGIALAQASALPEVFRIAHEHVALLVDCPNFGISLYKAETETLAAAFILGDGELLDVTLFPPLKIDKENLSGKGRARAILTQQAEVVTDMPTASSGTVTLVGRAGDDHLPQSALYVPMVAEGKTIGLLEVQSYRENAYSESAIALLRPVANQVGLAIQNIRLFAELEAERDLLEKRIFERTAELQDAKQRVEAILINNPDAILLLSRDLRVRQTNPAFNKQFDSQIDEYFGRSLFDLIDQQDVPRLTAAVQIGTGDFAPLRIEARALRRDGTLFDAALSIGYIPNNGIVCTISDITILKQGEETLRQALAAEKELGELKSRFVSMASHEFRTPLATILATADTLSTYRQRMDEDQIDQKLSKIKQQVSHLKDIMDDVLQLARLQARRSDFNPAMVDLDALCANVIEEFQSRQDVDHELTYVCEGFPPAAWLDKRLMRQIVSNLVANAIKYSLHHQPIRIHLAATAQVIVLSVADKGIGIPESDLKHLFEPFHRAGNVGTIPGTGLGLVITKESVDLHGGTISVESRLNVGTTFTVHIPLITELDLTQDENPGH